MEIRSPREFRKTRIGYLWNGLHESSIYIDLIRQFFSKPGGAPALIRKVKWRPLNWRTTSTLEELSPFPLVITGHIYYHDFLPKFLELLSRVDLPFDLMVTTSEPEIYDGLLALDLKYLAYLNKSEFRLVPNRGRNFGPLLVEFGTEIAQKYEYMLHVHSKKSLHTAALRGWGDYLYARIFPETKSIKSFIKEFKEREKLGLIFPPYFEYLGYLRDPWGGNRDAGDKWLTMNNFEKSSEDFTFPAGGMFWAKVAAINPLLNADWSYDNFSNEESADDVNFKTAYVVERLIGVVSDQLGYEKLYSLGHGFTEDESFKNRSPIYSRFFDRLLIRNIRSCD